MFRSQNKLLTLWIMLADHDHSATSVRSEEFFNTPNEFMPSNSGSGGTQLAGQDASVETPVFSKNASGRETLDPPVRSNILSPFIRTASSLGRKAGEYTASATTAGVMP